MAVKKYDETLLRAGYLSLRKRGGSWTPAKAVGNLLSVHTDRNALIPAIEYQDVRIGITSLGFIRFTKTKLKNQEESPYSAEGRELYMIRTGRRRPTRKSRRPTVVYAIAIYCVENKAQLVQLRVFAQPCLCV